MKTKRRITATAKRAALLLALALALAGGKANAQVAGLPFFADESARPNVMLMIDTSGSMDTKVDTDDGNRSRLQIVKDVLVGSYGGLMNNYTYPVYVPTAYGTGGDFILEHPSLVDKENYKFNKLIPVVRTRYLGTGWYCPNDRCYGAYEDGNRFTFVDPDLADMIEIYPEVYDATDTFDSFMMDQGGYHDCVQYFTNPVDRGLRVDSSRSPTDDQYEHPIGTDVTYPMYYASASCNTSTSIRNEDVRTDYWNYRDGGTVEPVSADTIKQYYLDAMPGVHLTEDQTQDNVPGPEFIVQVGGGLKMDIHIRNTLGITPNPPLLNTMDLSEPDLGSYFDDCYYKRAKGEVPGIMDVYPEVNYGLMIFDNNGSTWKDDFPDDSQYGDVGADLVVNVASWADFPAYANYVVGGYTVNSDLVNAYTQNVIADLDAGGWTPVASMLLGAVRYFYNGSGLSIYGGPYGATVEFDWATPNERTVFGDNSQNDDGHGYWYDLDWPENTGGLSESDRIIQDDPYYVNGCRRNFVILLTDGAQTQGEPFSESGGYPSGADEENAVISMQITRVRELALDGVSSLSGIPEFNKRSHAVKAYIIGFGGDVSDEQMALQLHNMATASVIDPSWDGDSAELVATDSNELMLSFSTIMNSIMKGQFARTAPEISTTEDVVITSYFNRDGDYPLWKGHLIAWDIEPVPGTTTTDEIWLPIWDDINATDQSLPGDAAAALTNETTPASRVMITAVKTGSDPDDLTKYDFDTGSAGNLYYSFFKDKYPSSTRNEMAEEVISFVRGDGTFFTDRPAEWRLNAIFRSKPQVVRRPNNYFYRNLADYEQFMIDNADRESMIYVGSMGGAIHAFGLHDSSTTSFEGGREVFAYVPPGVHRHLELLREGLQIYGVDGTPVVEDVYFTEASPNAWHTVLLAGLGGGGTSYMALDITDVRYDDRDAAEPLWTFSDEHLGETWSVPFVNFIKYDDGSDVKSIQAALFGGGLTPATHPGRGGYFYVLNVETGDTLAVFEAPAPGQISGSLDGFSLDKDDDISGTNDNEIPGSPNFIDADGDGNYDWAYVGDLKGRIWKYNLHDPDPDNWKGCIFYDFTDTDLDGTSDGEQYRRPVWYTPTVGRGPNNTILVFAYSGHLEVQTNEGDSVSHRLVQLLDPATPGGNECMYAQELQVGSTVNFPYEFEPGEKPLGPIILTGGELIFKTAVAASQNPCAAAEGRLYAMDYLTGDWTRDFDPSTSGNEPYETTDSLSPLTLAPDGDIWESDTTPKNYPGSGNAARPMSWGEGVAVP